MTAPASARRRPARLLLVQTHRTKRDDAMADDDRKLADPEKPYWWIADIAVYWGIKPETVHTYRTRGWLPPEDDRIGNSPVWFPKTIIDHKRPGQGARTDLKDRDDS